MNEVILKNPITNDIKEAVSKSRHKLNFAVPFLNSFALSILNADSARHIKDKRLITRFDPSCLISFDVPVLEKLKKLGFKIRYDNEIHLKLYITDSETFVTSSNLTKGGFENNIELTVKVDTASQQHCSRIFEEIWQNTQNEITDKLLEDNRENYHLLKKREQLAEGNKSSDIKIRIIEGGIDLQKIISEVFKMGEDYSYLRDFAFKANQRRELIKSKLHLGFDKKLFYVPEGHSMRYDNLFYDFTYGMEAKIAGTGLRELQFSTAFEHPEFQKAIQYIYPQMSGLKPWNLEDEQELFQFCIGLFEFKIPQYTEVLPIRMASYFYPEYFVPIFKLSDLDKICEALKLETDAKTRGERLFVYSSHIRKEMKHLPYDSNVKFNLAYIILYTFKLWHALQQGESLDGILSGTKKLWEKNYLKKGLQVLQQLGMVNRDDQKTES